MRRVGGWMRRSRFAGAIETNDADEKASIRETLWFDLRKHETSDEMSLADWRVAGLEHIALLLGFTHLLVLVGYLVLSPTFKFCVCGDNPLIPAGLTIGLDALVAAALFVRRRFNFESQ